MTNKKIIHFWAILFVALLMLFIALQVPAVWLLSKFAPNMRSLQNVSGNVWQGQADWNIEQLQGTVHWSMRPWELLRLRAASDVTIHSGQTELKGVLSYGVGKNIYLQQIKGQLSPETLAAILPTWQVPSTSIQLQDIHVQYKKNQGFATAKGQLSWAGGTLNYPIAQRFERIDIPPLVADVNADKQKLIMLIRDSQKQRMAEMSVGEDGMLDMQITQRFLMHSPTYQGKAGLDTAVISTRQPISSIGSR